MNQLAKSLFRLSLAPCTARNRVSALSLNVGGQWNGVCPLIQPQVQRLHITAPLESAMTKKKRRADPATLKAKEDRRRKKIAKALRKMMKKDRQPKPILELETPNVLYAEAELRTRPVEVSEDVKEERHYLKKDWTRFSFIRHRNTIYELDGKLIAQQTAMEELRKENEQLYLAACQIDLDLIPFSARGPTLTPPIKDYLQDGSYEDTTRQYKVVYEDTEAFMKKLLARDRRKKKKVEEEVD